MKLHTLMWLLYLCKTCTSLSFARETALWLSHKCTLSSLLLLLLAFSSKNITRLIKAMKVGESEREFDFIPQTASNVLVGPDFRYGKRQGTRKSSSCPHKPVNVSEVACKDFQRGICHASSGGIRFLNSTANRAKPS